MEMQFLKTAEARSAAAGRTTTAGQSLEVLYTNIGKTERDIEAMSIRDLNRILKLKGVSRKGIREIKLRRRQLMNK
jgi:hypothetical protein